MEFSFLNIIGITIEYKAEELLRLNTIKGSFVEINL